VNEFSTTYGPAYDAFNFKRISLPRIQNANNCWFPSICLLLVAAVVPTIPVRAECSALINKAVTAKWCREDVTMRLKRMVSNGTLDVKVSNDNMGGDPNKGADKASRSITRFEGSVSVWSSKKVTG
jgi:hypothetical protein